MKRFWIYTLVSAVVFAVLLVILTELSDIEAEKGQGRIIKD